MRRFVPFAALAALAAAACSSTPEKRRRADEVVLDAARAALDRHVKQHGAFPVASADRTPAAGCCNPGALGCTPAMLADLPWVDPAKLPPTFYVELTYESNGKTATVHALGNEDCDATYTDVELSGSLAGTTATWTVARNAAQD